MFDALINIGYVSV